MTREGCCGRYVPFAPVDAASSNRRHAFFNELVRLSLSRVSAKYPDEACSSLTLGNSARLVASEAALRYFDGAG